MPDYFDDDDIDDDALVAVLEDRHRQQPVSFFQCDDDFDDDALAVVLEDGLPKQSYQVYDFTANHSQRRPGKNIDNRDHFAARQNTVAGRPRSFAQTKIGSFFERSPIDPEFIRSAIAEFNRETKTPLSTDIESVTQLIYPVNFPKRDYQVECVEFAVRENTLVVLPTGLGKTFIASVLLSNMLRWFPTGKCIFMAPTRQLVFQQAKACSEMAPIPPNSMTVMLDVAPAARNALWQQYRLIFCTPQIVEKDIQSNRCPLDEIVCFVFDEAHHSKGNSAMAGIVGKRCQINGQFRVLALSATPGSDRAQIQTVLDNLLIKRVLPYNRKDPAIAKYVNDRDEEVVAIPLSDEIKNLLRILDELCRKPAAILQKHGLLGSNFTMHGPGYFRGDMFMRQLREKRLDKNWAVLGPKLTLQSLLTARQYLCNYSISAFVAQLEHDCQFSSNKGYASVSKDAAFGKAIELAKDYLSRSVLHPKLQRLRELVTAHFRSCPNSRTIVFVEYKMIVDEIVTCIGNCPGTLPIRFVGQQKSAGAGDSLGMRPKEQNEALEKFRSGRANVLVATCIGEEGLDIGEVDLVIEYDNASSALRTTQRMGRTARQRRGRCVALLMEGNEMRSYDSNQKNIENSFRILRSNLRLSTFPCSIRPANIPCDTIFKQCSDIIPWNPGQLVRKRSGLSKAKANPCALSSQLQRELDQDWKLDSPEQECVRGLKFITSADELQEPIQRLVGCSKISKILIDTMNMITKVRLGHIEIESGVLSPIPHQSTPERRQAPQKLPCATPIAQPDRIRSRFSPGKLSSDSDAELKQLLDDIDLFEEPNEQDHQITPIRSPTPQVDGANEHRDLIAAIEEEEDIHGNSNLIETTTEHVEKDLHESHEVIVISEDDQPENNTIGSVGLKRFQARKPAKRPRKKAKFGSSHSRSGSLFRTETPVPQEAKIPINVEKFYTQTTRDLTERREYLYFRFRQSNDALNRDVEPAPCVRFLPPAPVHSVDPFPDLFLPLNRSLD